MKILVLLMFLISVSSCAISPILKPLAISETKKEMVITIEEARRCNIAKEQLTFYEKEYKKLYTLYQIEKIKAKSLWWGVSIIAAFVFGVLSK